MIGAPAVLPDSFLIHAHSCIPPSPPAFSAGFDRLIFAMTGLSPDTPIPTEIRLHQKTRRLELVYENAHYELSHEFLRVFSPSAAVRGHGRGQETLQLGKRDVEIERIEPVGNYALRLVFSDGHDSGLYSWDLLYNFCRHRDALWQAYLDRLAAAGGSRDPAECPPSSQPPAVQCGLVRH